MKKSHICPNEFKGEGAKGGCYFEIEATEKEGIASLDVGWSCVVVHRAEIPISWLSEIIAIVTAHKGGIAGFLKEHEYGGGYALTCDPAERLANTVANDPTNITDQLQLNQQVTGKPTT